MDAPAAIVELVAEWDALGVDGVPGEIYRGAVKALIMAAFSDLAERRGTAPLTYDGSLLFGPDRFSSLPVPKPVACDEIIDLGHLYETLLGFTCRRDDDGRLGVVASSSRKHAGAHYTPPQLAEEVVRHALEPVVGDPATILDLRVADIAVGSGAFLLAAANDLASRVDGPPLGEVVATCLYGADIDELAIEVSRLSLWLLVGDPAVPLSFLDEHLVVGNALLVQDTAFGTPVDWESMAPGGFDAVVGNPPFLGVKGIRDAIGGDLRDHLADSLLDGESGRSDLAVYFLAQARRLSRGTIGLVLPAAIWVGDNYRFGLAAAFDDGFECYRAETSRPWPSDASVRIALAWLSRSPMGTPVLDGEPVAAIPVARRSETVARERPTWMPHGFQASIVLGKSLLLTRREADEMIREDPRSEVWIRDYLSGDDLVSSPGPTSSRQVLDLAGADIETLMTIPPIARRLRAVRAERDLQVAKYPQLADRWWTFLNRVDRLYDELAGLGEVIAFSKHAKYTWPVLVGTGPIFSNGAIVYPTDDRAVYGFLASTPHRIWATEEGGSRLNQSHRYNPSRLLQTYPFPDSIEPVRGPGEALAEAMADARDVLGVGVTEILNRVHGAGGQDLEIERIRGAIAEVDAAVLATHGMSRVTDPVQIRAGLVEISEAVDCASGRSAPRSKMLG